MAEQIRVLVVDDHAVVREGLRAFLELQDGIEVAGEAVDGQDAIESAKRLLPDVILMDLVMPRLDGVAAMRSLRESVPERARDRPYELPRRRQAAPGTSRRRRGVPAQERAAGGARPGGSRRARRRGRPRSRCRRPPRRDARSGGSDDQPLDRLTPREREVLILIARGFPNKRIARELGLAEKTVKTHVGHVLAKLGVSDRTQAAVIAVRAGLVGPGS